MFNGPVFFGDPGRRVFGVWERVRGTGSSGEPGVREARSQGFRGLGRGFGAFVRDFGNRGWGSG